MTKNGYNNMGGGNNIGCMWRSWLRQWGYGVGANNMVWWLRCICENGARVKDTSDGDYGSSCCCGADGGGSGGGYSCGNDAGDDGGCSSGNNDGGNDGNDVRIIDVVIGGQLVL